MGPKKKTIVGLLVFNLSAPRYASCWDCTVVDQAHQHRQPQSKCGLLNVKFYFALLSYPLKRGFSWIFFIIYKRCSTLRTSSAVPQIPLCRRLLGCNRTQVCCDFGIDNPLYIHSVHCSYPSNIESILFHNQFSLFLFISVSFPFFFFQYHYKKILCLFYTILSCTFHALFVVWLFFLLTFNISFGLFLPCTVYSLYSLYTSFVSIWNNEHTLSTFYIP
jgi:hypothetical protein